MSQGPSRQIETRGILNGEILKLGKPKSMRLPRTLEVAGLKLGIIPYMTSLFCLK